MKVLFDTNVMLDALLDRDPFASSAILLFAKVELGELQGYLCATTVTTTYYLAAKINGHESATEMVGKLLAIFDVAPVNRYVLEDALAQGSSDFEDAVLYASACLVGADAIVTRDQTGFRAAEMPILSPPELLHLLQAMN